MKSYLTIIAIAICLFSCKDQNKETIAEPEKKELTIAEKIAQSNGIENWKDINEIRFTFNVDRPDSHFERSWIWRPKTDDVTKISATETVSYNRKAIDSLTLGSDRSFINDKFWLLAPYNLVWDEGTTITYKDSVQTNITGETLNQLTITYGSDGGYTPGDAYDFFYDKDFMIKEWIYRKSAQKEPSMITTWEDYEDFQGIKIAKTHLGKDNNVKLYFTDILVE